MANPYALVIGNKRYSSWSLRPWLAMTCAKISFEEINVDLRAPDKRERIMAHSPSGKVPALVVDGDVIWDSLAILEFLAERHPDAGIWPQDARATARARSVAAEMHSGFGALRENCPMDIVTRAPRDHFSDAVAADIRRIVAIWTECRSRFGDGGPFLFGGFCAADAMYAPVASRFRTYVADPSRFGDGGAAATYVETIFAMPEMAAWIEGAEAETARMDAVQ